MYEVIGVVGQRYDTLRHTILVSDFNVYILNHDTLEVSVMNALNLRRNFYNVIARSITWSSSYSFLRRNVGNITVSYTTQASQLIVNNTAFTPEDVPGCGICFNNLISVSTRQFYSNCRFMYLFKFNDYLVTRWRVIDGQVYVVTLLFNIITGEFLGACDNSGGRLIVICDCKPDLYKFAMLCSNMEY